MSADPKNPPLIPIQPVADSGATPEPAAPRARSEQELLAAERRLHQLRREASEKGVISAPGVRAVGSPLPPQLPEKGYYETPLLKEPQWKWEVPLYFFVGGAAGASSVIAGMADWTGADRRLVQHARWLAVGGSAVSAGLLVADLGMPSRFLNMLRVFKPQSPMSVGAWVLSAFSSLAAATLFASLIRERFGDSLPVRVVEEVSQLGATVSGLPMATYTGVLIGASVIPVWNRNVGTLPIHFGASGLNSAVSLLELAGHDRNRALNWMGIAAALYESYEGVAIESRSDEALLPLKRGLSGGMVRAGGVLSGPVPLLLRTLGLFRSRESARSLRRTAAVCSIAGSILTRYGWLQAGHASARNFRLPLELDTPANELLPASDPRHLRDSTI